MYKYVEIFIIFSDFLLILLLIAEGKDPYLCRKIFRVFLNRGSISLLVEFVCKGSKNIPKVSPIHVNKENVHHYHSKYVLPHSLR